MKRTGRSHFNALCQQATAGKTQQEFSHRQLHPPHHDAFSFHRESKRVTDDKHPGSSLPGIAVLYLAHTHEVADLARSLELTQPRLHRWTGWSGREELPVPASPTCHLLGFRNGCKLKLVSDIHHHLKPSNACKFEFK